MIEIKTKHAKQDELLTVGCGCLSCTLLIAGALLVLGVLVFVVRFAWNLSG
jgi:hypothetical protein